VSRKVNTITITINQHNLGIAWVETDPKREASLPEGDWNLT
jgi:hypothetical protein